jgi:peroxiredoxin
MRVHLWGRLASLLVIASLVALAGCSSQTVIPETGPKVSDDGAVAEFPRADRGKPITLTGQTSDGTSFQPAAVSGKVVVLNFWYAGCAPCRVEAASLQSLFTEFEQENVAFVGVDTYDTAATANAFRAHYGVTFPSILDRDTGAVQLQLAGTYSTKATPATIVLDKQGRPAARILGPIDESVLRTLIRDQLDQ